MKNPLIALLLLLLLLFAFLVPFGATAQATEQSVVQINNPITNVDKSASKDKEIPFQETPSTKISAKKEAVPVAEVKLVIEVKMVDKKKFILEIKGIDDETAKLTTKNGAVVSHTVKDGVLTTKAIEILAPNQLFRFHLEMFKVEYEKELLIKVEETDGNFLVKIAEEETDQEKLSTQKTQDYINQKNQKAQDYINQINELIRDVWYPETGENKWYIILDEEIKLFDFLSPADTKWESSDSRIVSVDNRGNTVAQACGVAEIKVSAGSYSTHFSLVVPAKKVQYGVSQLGRPLVAYGIRGPDFSGKRSVEVFEQHGFEDHSFRDGQKLVECGNNLVNYYKKNTDNLKGYETWIVPSANPDGVIEGWNNHQAGAGAFGRCLWDNQDPNRIWNQANPSPEVATLRSFINDLNNLEFVIDFHGWLNNCYGNATIAEIFGLRYAGGVPSSYLAGYYNSLGIQAALVEYPPADADTNRTIQALNQLFEL